MSAPLLSVENVTKHFPVRRGVLRVDSSTVVDTRAAGLILHADVTSQQVVAVLRGAAPAPGTVTAG